MTEFALDIGAKLITFFEDYFQIKYPMVKEGNPVYLFLFIH